MYMRSPTAPLDLNLNEIERLNSRTLIFRSPICCIGAELRPYIAIKHMKVCEDSNGIILFDPE